MCMLRDRVDDLLGRHDMPAQQLVPGDVIELRIGDSVPADDAVRTPPRAQGPPRAISPVAPPCAPG